MALSSLLTSLVVVLVLGLAVGPIVWGLITLCAHTDAAYIGDVYVAEPTVTQEPPECQSEQDAFFGLFT